MNSEIRQNLDKIKEGWVEWKDECIRIVERFFDSITQKDKRFRPFHDLHGIMTATIKLPYRTWGILAWFYILAQFLPAAPQEPVDCLPVEETAIVSPE
jgi:hypothetical protein